MFIAAIIPSTFLQTPS